MWDTHCRDGVHSKHHIGQLHHQQHQQQRGGYAHTVLHAVQDAEGKGVLCWSEAAGCWWLTQRKQTAPMPADELPPSLAPPTVQSQSQNVVSMCSGCTYSSTRLHGEEFVSVVAVREGRQALAELHNLVAAEVLVILVLVVIRPASMRCGGRSSRRHAAVGEDQASP